MRWITIAFLALALVACGNPPTQQAEQSIVASPEPTLTAKERAAMQTVATRAQSMAKAAQDLQRLGQELRATVEWQAKVKAAAQVITGGQKTIAPITFPALYSNLEKSIKEGAANCAKSAEALLALSAPTTADVQAQRESLTRWCVTEMQKAQRQAEDLQ